MTSAEKATTPLWDLATDYVLEKIKNGDLDRYGNLPPETMIGCLEWGITLSKPTEHEMRAYVEQSRNSTLPEKMDWQSVCHVDTYFGIGAIIGY